MCIWECLQQVSFDTINIAFRGYASASSWPVQDVNAAMLRRQRDKWITIANQFKPWVTYADYKLAWHTPRKLWLPLTIPRSGIISQCQLPLFPNGRYMTVDLRDEA